MSELSRLIARLQRGIVRNASYVKTIRHPHLLVASLQELNELIGNEKVKDSVATQVSHLIMVKRRAIENSTIKEDNCMNHALIFSGPGSGKTTVGIKLAKIWYSLGYIDGSKNTKDKKQEISGIIKDLFKDGSNNTTNDTTLTFYILFIFTLVFITLLSMTWSLYNKLGGIWTISIISLILSIIIIFGIYIYSSLNSNPTKDINKDKPVDTKGTSCGGKDCPTEKEDKATEDISTIEKMPSEDEIIKVVSRVDFIDKYVGWTSPKTIKLLEENLGKVLFVDEAYSLLNGPHDEFGMEALTALNLFMSQHPNEIIIIFAGYRDLIESGPFSVQPGLFRRFMWQFDCGGYTTDQLFQIFKMQLNKKGWGLSDEKATLQIFLENPDAFPSYGGDTERCTFMSKLEHSRDYISNEKGMGINILEPKHVKRGIAKLRENNIHNSQEQSHNPLANMMKLMSKKSNQDSLFKDETPEAEIFDNIRNHSTGRMQR